MNTGNEVDNSSRRYLKFHHQALEIIDLKEVAIHQSSIGKQGGIHRGNININRTPEDNQC